MWAREKEAINKEKRKRLWGQIADPPPPLRKCMFRTQKIRMFLFSCAYVYILTILGLQILRYIDGRKVYNKWNIKEFSRNIKHKKERRRGMYNQRVKNKVKKNSATPRVARFCPKITFAQVHFGIKIFSSNIWQTLLTLILLY